MSSITHHHLHISTHTNKKHTYNEFISSLSKTQIYVLHLFAELGYIMKSSKMSHQKMILKATVLLKKPTNDLLLQVRRLVLNKDSKLTSFVVNFFGAESHLPFKTSGHGATNENHFLNDGAYLMVCDCVYIIIMNKRFIRRLTTKKKSISRVMEAIMVSCN